MWDHCVPWQRIGCYAHFGHNWSWVVAHVTHCNWVNCVESQFLFAPSLNYAVFYLLSSLNYYIMKNSRDRYSLTVVVAYASHVPCIQLLGMLATNETGLNRVQNYFQLDELNIQTRRLYAPVTNRLPAHSIHPIAWCLQCTLVTVSMVQFPAIHRTARKCVNSTAGNWMKTQRASVSACN